MTAPKVPTASQLYLCFDHMHWKTSFCYYNSLSSSFYLDISQEKAAQEKLMH